MDNLFNTKLIQKEAKLPKQIKISLQKGKLLEKEWDNDNLFYYTNDCIHIENNIKKMNSINERINQCNIKTLIKFYFLPKMIH